MTEKELKSLLKLLRSQGVLEYSHGGLTLKLSEDLPAPKARAKEDVAPELTPDEIPFEDLPYEQQLFYSADIPMVEQPEES